MWLTLFFFFCLVKKPLCFLYLFFLQVAMSQDRVVTCFHEYVMKKKKKYEGLVLYIIAIVRKGKQKEERRKLHHHQRSPKMRV